MLNRDLLRLYNVLDQLRSGDDLMDQRRQNGEENVPAGRLKPGRFNVALAYNISILRLQGEALRSVFAQPWLGVIQRDYTPERNAAVLPFLANPEGHATMRAGVIYGVADKEGYDAAEKAMSEKYAEALAAQEQAEHLLNAEAAPVSLIKVKWTDFPDLSLAESDALVPMVDKPVDNRSEMIP